MQTLFSLTFASKKLLVLIFWTSSLTSY